MEKSLDSGEKCDSKRSNKMECQSPNGIFPGSGAPLNLDIRVRNGLARAGFVSHSVVVLTSDVELRRLSNLTQEDCNLAKQVAANAIINGSFTTAFDLERPDLQERQYITTGCHVLDKCLGGGFALRGITEIAGESGAGKTQICLQAALCVQFPTVHGGLQAGAVYICTEDTFPSIRFQQLLKEFAPNVTHCAAPTVPSNASDNIFIEHVPDSDSLKRCILIRLQNLLSRHRIGLIVIDSIAGAFRAEYDPKHGAINRAQDLRSLGCQLHKIATQFHLAVICVNQVTTVPGEMGRTVPALGLAWANLVTTRVQIKRTDRAVTEEKRLKDLVPQRTLSVEFCPYLAHSICSFVISGRGVRGVENSSQDL